MDDDEGAHTPVASQPRSLEGGGDQQKNNLWHEVRDMGEKGTLLVQPSLALVGQIKSDGQNSLLKLSFLWAVGTLGDSVDWISITHRFFPEDTTLGRGCVLSTRFDPRVGTYSSQHFGYVAPFHNRILRCPARLSPLPDPVRPLLRHANVSLIRLPSSFLHS